MTNPSVWLYIAACLVVPALWGGFTAWAFSRSDKRSTEAANRRQDIDYMI